MVAAVFPFLQCFYVFLPGFSLRKKIWSKFTEFPTHETADLQYILGAPKFGKAAKRSKKTPPVEKSDVPVPL